MECTYHWSDTDDTGPKWVAIVFSNKLQPVFAKVSLDGKRMSIRMKHASGSSVVLQCMFLSEYVNQKRMLSIPKSPPHTGAQLGTLIALSDFSVTSTGKE